MKKTEEAGGHVATCACGWVRFDPSQVGLAEAIHGHGKKCKRVAESLTQSPIQRYHDGRMGMQSGPESAQRIRGLRPLPAKDK